MKYNNIFMEYEIVGRPSYATLVMRLSDGESVTFEAGAFVAAKGNYRMRTHTGGGFLGAIMRAAATGESIFVNTLEAGPGGCEVILAPSYPGDIKDVELRGESLIVQDFAYMAHVGDISYKVKWKGFKGVLTGGGVMWLKLEGVGKVFLSAFGAILEKKLEPGEEMIVDNFNLLAAEESVGWEIVKIGGLKTAVLGGEGIGIKLVGPGRVYIQTRSIPPFAALLKRFLPK